jgi:predicted nucleic acid-binding protein
VIVLDTNVVSELMRGTPASTVLAWLDRHVGERLTTTAITVAEVRYGIARLPDGARRAALERAADDAFRPFADDVLPFDLGAATAYAEIVGDRERLGRPIDGFDAQIAAICRAHGATLATRNGRDFVETGVTTADPWASAPATREEALGTRGSGAIDVPPEDAAPRPAG